MDNLVEQMNELDNQIVHRGYTHKNLSEAFKLIEDKLNWKYPLHGVIDVCDFDICDAAAEYFTGAGITISGTNGTNMIGVYGPGYYQTIGA